MHSHEIIFVVESVMSKTKKGDAKIFDTILELKDLVENNGWNDDN